jgi:hypothetical protein
MTAKTEESFSTPVSYLFYNRPQCIEITFPIIQRLRPKKLYLLADGPKNSDDEKLCQKSRKLIEQFLDWDCQVTKIYSEKNLGLAHRTVSAIDTIFRNEDRIIFLEDDNLVDSSFFSFCNALLDRYEHEERIFHIGGCNFFENAVPLGTKEGYLFSTKPAAWGFATWKRAWKHMDLRMENWATEDKDSFLRKWCVSPRHANGIREVFDQHCMNKDPWAWSYAWTYACWSNNALSIVPKVNLVSNIGFGPDATNTTMIANNWTGIPESRGSLQEIRHPDSISRNLAYDKKSYYFERGTPLRRLKQFVKGLLKT